MRLDRESGWVFGARHVPSPNHDDRPVGTSVNLLVIHGISLPPGRFGGDCVERFFTNALPPGEHPFFREIASMHVSAHLFLRRDGALLQFVSLHKRAWHAGVSSFLGRERCNDYSIGIELEGTDTVAYTARQYRRLATVGRLLMRHYPAITPDRMVGHSDVAPGRKTDPGPAFDWQRFRAAL
ncbi:MAG: 1,6-anhydro-N-acetylmuramyl-L-alanine amidase AmpD [Gammaproteobacteria bacterium]|nr:1,6-anhydro-N-acetylmuramyl-L-alanine amidase AmpD [Gammaproteobacteria bacterium]